MKVIAAELCDHHNDPRETGKLIRHERYNEIALEHSRLLEEATSERAKQSEK